MRGILAVDLTLDMRRDPHRQAPISEWLSRHGIDPDDVIVPSTLVIDDETRTINYVGFHRDERGQRHTPRHCPGHPDLPMSDGACRLVVTVQLESPALPFPDVVV